MFAGQFLSSKTFNILEEGKEINNALTLAIAGLEAGEMYEARYYLFMFCRKWPECEGGQDSAQIFLDEKQVKKYAFTSPESESSVTVIKSDIAWTSYSFRFVATADTVNVYLNNCDLFICENKPSNSPLFIWEFSLNLCLRD